VGVVLGWRAALAIPVGLFLQAALMQHGGFTTIGSRLHHGAPCPPGMADVRPAQARAVGSSALVPGRVGRMQRPGLDVEPGLQHHAAVYHALTQLDKLDTAWADRLTFHPITLAAALLLAVLAAWAERRLENAPEFPLGLLIGEVSVLATMLLTCLVLLWGGQEDWHTLALLTFVAHLPIAVVEGVVLGFTVGFLVRVKPEMLRWTVPEETECVADAVP